MNGGNKNTQNTQYKCFMLQRISLRDGNVTSRFQKSWEKEVLYTQFVRNFFTSALVCKLQENGVKTLNSKTLRILCGGGIGIGVGIREESSHL